MSSNCPCALRLGFGYEALNSLDSVGLDACKFGFTGAAPIMTETLEYFGQLGIQINEVYGALRLIFLV